MSIQKPFRTYAVGGLILCALIAYQNCGQPRNAGPLQSTSLGISGSNGNPIAPAGAGGSSQASTPASTPVSTPVGSVPGADGGAGVDGIVVPLVFFNLGNCPDGGPANEIDVAGNWQLARQNCKPVTPPIVLDPRAIQVVIEQAGPNYAMNTLIYDNLIFDKSGSGQVTTHLCVDFNHKYSVLIRYLSGASQSIATVFASNGSTVSQLPADSVSLAGAYDFEDASTGFQLSFQNGNWTFTYASQNIGAVQVNCLLQDH